MFRNIWYFNFVKFLYFIFLKTTLLFIFLRNVLHFLFFWKLFYLFFLFQKLFYIFSYFYYLRKIIFCKTTLISIHFIKSTVLGWTLWSANIFPTRNRLPNLEFGSYKFYFWFFYSFFIINYGDNSQSKFKYFLKINFRYCPVVILVALDGDSTRDILRVRPANLIK